MYLAIVHNLLSLFKGLLVRQMDWSYVTNMANNSHINKNAKLYSPFHVDDTNVGYGTYIAKNSWISNTYIGKFCSIGPDFLCGWGIHPTNTLSTSPMFYSSKKQNGHTLSKSDKIIERLPIYIGNDVFIGSGVTILDNVKIADGAIIAAGAVVVNDVPAYAIVGGVPAKVIKYRFDNDQISKLVKIKWWDWPEIDLSKIEKMFFEVDSFIAQHYNGE